MKNDATIHKKMATLLILEILKRYTDDAFSDGKYIHTLTQTDIKEKLESDYGLKLDRKAVSRNLNDLIISYEDKIEYDEVPRSFKDGDPDDGNIKTNFRYIHDFDAGQIRMLINAVLFSHSLSESECKQLIEKISKLGGLDQRNRMQKHLFNLGLYTADKVTNDSLLNNLDVLDEAIDKGRQVSFCYNYFGKDKKLHKKMEDGKEKVYIVSPYRMVANNGRFYLKCNHDQYDTVTTYRIDKITDIDLTDIPSKPKNKVKGIDDNAKTEAEMLYMQPGNHERIVFRIPDTENAVSDVIDWLGKSVRFEESDGKIVICSVKANPDAIKFWALQYSGMVEILEPESLRDDIRTSLREVWRKYNDSNDTLIESDDNIKKLLKEWKQICAGVTKRKAEGRIFPDVRKLGELVRKTHLILLPLRNQEITGQYSELILGLEKCHKSTRTGIISEANSISLVLHALLAETEDGEIRRRRNIPDDVLPIRIHTEEDGRIEVNINVNNFEEDYVTLLQYTDKNAEETRRMMDEFREKMREKHKEMWEQRRKEREEQKAKEKTEKNNDKGE